MPSFDIVIESNRVELRDAGGQSNKEVATVKASRLKLHAATQGENRGIRGAQRDGLQVMFALLRRKHTEWPLTLQLRRA